ncbi:MAG: helix-turn-helix domain-containing protein [Terriglobia bacterium]
MTHAYSRLKQVLDERQISVPELHRRITKRGMRINLKSLYRLSYEHQPLERLDLRVAGAICQVCEVPLSDLITFEGTRRRLQRFSAAKQKRLDTLMTKNNEGQVTPEELEELRALVREAEEMTLINARILTRQRQRLVAQ